MSDVVRVKGVVETVITDDDLNGSSRTAKDMVSEQSLSKAVMKAFRRAKKVSAKENVRACGIVSTLRARREGTTEAITEAITEDKRPTSIGEQASIFDY